jgi:hypothetical protein
MRILLSVIVTMFLILSASINERPSEAREFVSSGSHTLTVINNSSVDITRVHVAWSKTGRWGADLLGKGVFRRGSSLPISLAAGEYDLMLVDSRNRSCVARAIAVYSDRSWSFNDQWLSECPQ